MPMEHASKKFQEACRLRALRRQVPMLAAPQHLGRQVMEPGEGFLRMFPRLLVVPAEEVASAAFDPVLQQGLGSGVTSAPHIVFHHGPERVAAEDLEDAQVKDV